ncbi:LpxT activity modulator PmrR [Escherichia coli]|nr:LpxT activity modulator PmrR [Escherichia coli]
MSDAHTLRVNGGECNEKNRVYESLTTVFSVLVVSSFLYIWFATY